MVKKLWKSIIDLIKGGILYILTGSVLANAITMISSVVIARLIDKAEYAALAYADNFYGYITLASGLGLSTAMLKFAAVSDSPKERSKYFNYSFVCGGTFNLSLSLFLCVIVTYIQLPFENAKKYIYLLCLYPVLQNILNTISSYLRSSLRNKEYAVVGIIQSVVVCILSILCVIVVGAAGIISARYTGILIALILGIVLILKKEKLYYREHLNHSEKKHVLATGISLMFANLFSGMMPINESFLINNIIQDEIITANFKVAGLVPSQIYLITSALAVYFFPVVSKLTRVQDIKKTFYKAGIINLGIVLICTLVGLIITPVLIRLLYGPKYEDAIPISYMLWGIRGMNAGVRMLPMNLLPALGKVRFNAALAMISTLVQFGLDYILIFLYGIDGIIYGSTIVYLVSGIAYWLYFIHVCKNWEGNDTIL